MQEFTEEYKKIKDTLDRYWDERASTRGIAFYLLKLPIQMLLI
ncbi:hypothetical protein ES705_42490 [subsurface metagenome]